jgi:hypothetical protein
VDLINGNVIMVIALLKLNVVMEILIVQKICLMKEIVHRVSFEEFSMKKSRVSTNLKFLQFSRRIFNVFLHTQKRFKFVVI